MLNRLQIRHEKKLYKNKNEIINAINRSGKDILFSEPIVFKYGDSSNPNIVLAIGNDGKSPNSPNYFLIDTASLDSDITKLYSHINDINEKINNIKVEPETNTTSVDTNDSNTIKWEKKTTENGTELTAFLKVAALSETFLKVTKDGLMLEGVTDFFNEKIKEYDRRSKNADDYILKLLKDFQNEAFEINNEVLGKVTDIDSKVKKLQGDVKEHITDANSTLKKVEKIYNYIENEYTDVTINAEIVDRVNNVKNDVDDINKKLDKIGDDISENVKELQDSVSDIEKNVSSNASGITELNSKVTDIETDISNNTSGITNLNDKVSIIEGAISSNASGITNLNDKVSVIEDVVSNNTSGITGINDRIVTIEESISSNASGITDLNGKVSDIEDVVSNNTSGITSLNDKVVTIEESISNNASGITDLNDRFNAIDWDDIGKNAISASKNVIKIGNDIRIGVNYDNGVISLYKSDIIRGSASISINKTTVEWDTKLTGITVTVRITQEPITTLVLNGGSFSNVELIGEITGNEIKKTDTAITKNKGISYQITYSDGDEIVNATASASLTYRKVYLYGTTEPNTENFSTYQQRVMANGRSANLSINIGNGQYGYFAIPVSWAATSTPNENNLGCTFTDTSNNLSGGWVYDGTFISTYDDKTVYAVYKTTNSGLGITNWKIS